MDYHRNRQARQLFDGIAAQYDWVPDLFSFFQVEGVTCAVGPYQLGCYVLVWVEARALPDRGYVDQLGIVDPGIKQVQVEGVTCAALDAIGLATGVEQPAAGVGEAHALDSLAGGVFVGRQRGAEG